MELTRSSKEIIDHECEKIELIEKRLIDTGHRYNDPVKTALAIYLARHEDISIIYDEEYD